MQTIFSHIVRKRLSQESENVATAALEFILDSSEPARNGMMKLLRGIVPQMPRLWFRTQRTEGGSRPDMWGNDDKARSHVLVENKFWAGLTDNQPVSYLQILAKEAHPTILLVVAPSAREQTLWRELKRKLKEAGVSATEEDASAGIVRSFTTGLGPILALTSWTELLSFLEQELVDDPSARGDLLQLRALCEAMDQDAFVPISSEVVSDQRTPSLILQLNSIFQTSVDVAVTERVLDLTGMRPQADATRIGRYAYLGMERRVGIWFGVHFRLWKEYGGTPLWVVFSPGASGRSPEVRELLEPWSAQTGVFTASELEHFVVAMDMPFGEEKDTVVKAIVERLKQIAGVLSAMKPNSQPTDTQDVSE